MSGAARCLPGAVLLGVLVLVPSLMSQVAPLPDPAGFFGAVRMNLERSRRDARGFAYTERRTQLHMNPFGRLGSGATLAYRVTPSVDGVWVERQLIERDRVPVTDGEVTKRESRGPGSRTGRQSPYDDALSVLEFMIERREQEQGRSMIVVRFIPRPGVTARTREGRMAKSFEGEVWVDERAEEVVRVEATAIESLSYGFGLVARLSKGTTVIATREEVLRGVWQPTTLRINGDGRALVFRRLRIEHALEWFDYRHVPGVEAVPQGPDRDSVAPLAP